MSVDKMNFYYLEKGPIFADDLDMLAIEWEREVDNFCIVPESVRFEAGSEPGKLVFSVYADKFLSTTPVYPPVATTTITARRPDGTDGDFSIPCSTSDPTKKALKPFTLIRLSENPTAETEDPGVVRFVGVLLACQIDLKSETWLCTALEIPRWRMSKYVVRGTMWHDTRLDGNTPPDPVNPVFFEDTIPIFNEDGKRDMWKDIDGNRVLEFFHPDYKWWTLDYSVTFWRVGDILNYLRKLYWVVDVDSGKTILGIRGLSGFMDWPEVTVATHPWLFLEDTVDQVVSDLALGSMTLLEAIDVLVRKGGHGSEFTTVFSNSTFKWTLHFYDKAGISSIDLSRGLAGSSTEEPYQIASGSIGYDWTKCADSVLVFGKDDKHEVTIAYDPLNRMNSNFQDVLQPAWEGAAQNAYQNAELAMLDAADTNYPDVYVKFKFKEEADWTKVFDDNGENFPKAKQGIREVFSKMLTKTKTGDQEIQAKLWRWKLTDGTGPLFDSQPSYVTLHFNPDGTISITGKDKSTVIPLPLTSIHDSNTKPARYLCEIPTDYEDPWLVRPFIITLSVYGDERVIGKDYAGAPADWPTLLEDSPDLVKLENHWRYRTFFFVDDDDNVVEDNPTAVKELSLSPEAIQDHRLILQSAAKRRRAVVERPVCSGNVSLIGEIEWDITPGVKIDTITGGGTPIPLEDFHTGSLIRSVTISGLGTKGETREQYLEVGNG